jgi:hypothetical protein
MTQPPPEPDVCPILHLELGPLDLNLLGLRVQLNQVVLDITAIQTVWTWARCLATSCKA